MWENVHIVDKMFNSTKALIKSLSSISMRTFSNMYDDTCERVFIVILLFGKTKTREYFLVRRKYLNEL